MRRLLITLPKCFSTQAVDVYEAEAGRVQFHTAISRGMSPVDLRYKVANAISTLPKWPATLMTAKRIGEAEVLNGEQILDDIEANLVRI